MAQIYIPDELLMELGIDPNFTNASEEVVAILRSIRRRPGDTSLDLLDWSWLPESFLDEEEDYY